MELIPFKIEFIKNINYFNPTARCELMGGLSAPPRFPPPRVPVALPQGLRQGGFSLLYWLHLFGRMADSSRSPHS